MARKTKTCNKVKLETPTPTAEADAVNVQRLVMRTCWRPRLHDGDCMDDRGNWHG